MPWSFTFFLRYNRESNPCFVMRCIRVVRLGRAPNSSCIWNCFIMSPSPPNMAIWVPRSGTPRESDLGHPVGSDAFVQVFPRTYWKSSDDKFLVRHPYVGVTAPRKNLRVRSRRESQASTVVGVESIESTLCPVPWMPSVVHSGSPKVHVESARSQVVGRIAAFATEV